MGRDNGTCQWNGRIDLQEMKCGIQKLGYHSLISITTTTAKLSPFLSLSVSPSLSPSLSLSSIRPYPLYAQNIRYDPCIQMSSEDWDSFTLHGLLVNEDEVMGQESRV